MRRIGALLLVLCLVLAGCDAADDPGGEGSPGKDAKKIPAGVTKVKIDVGTPGHREYLLKVPRGLEGPAPLVVAVHGGASTAARFQDESGFDTVADKEGFIVAYPDGFMLSWNAGGCCGPAKVGKLDDVGFLTKVIDSLVKKGYADPEKVFVAGFSNGGGMAYRMACEGPGRVRAIGVVSAALIMDCDPSRPVSAMIVHGTADRSVPFDGGGKRDFNDSRGFPPVREAVRFWLDADGTRPLRRSGACEQAEGRATVRFCKIDGGTHRWPDGMARDLWDFFADQ